MALSAKDQREADKYAKELGVLRQCSKSRCSQWLISWTGAKVWCAEHMETKHDKRN